jgi:flagellar basal-body rod modification protein FlgD
MTTPPISPFEAFAESSQQRTDKTADKGAASEASEQMFLKLLVAQLKNQDPMQPADGTQFVAQLAQFSELEQVIAIRKNTDAIVNPAQDAQTTSKTGD